MQLFSHFSTYENSSRLLFRQQVGFHGRDVDQIIRDLVENAIALERIKAKRRLAATVAKNVERRLVEALVGSDADNATIEQFRSLLRDGDLDERTVDVEVPPNNSGRGGMLSAGNGELNSGMQELVIKVDQIFGSKVRSIIDCSRCAAARAGADGR